MLTTERFWSGRPVLVVCDRRCERAWGVNGRRHDPASSIEFDQDDDVVYLADHEVPEAPRDPGTYEGGDGKPMHPEAHNRWCMRECERCEFIEAGEPIRYRDLSKRLYNQPWKHAEADPDRMIDTGQTFTPSGSPDRRG